MKKHILLAARILTIFAVAFSLTTCGDFLKPGLGDKVDLEDPDVTIDSHRDGQYLSGQVTFEGTFADDIAGDSIRVSTDGGSSFSSATRVDKKNGAWSHDVDTTQLADGEYEVRVRVTDTADKTTDAKILVYFDNTAPAVLVRTPQGLDSTAFNQTISLQGDAYDPFGVTSIELELHETDGSGTIVDQLALRRDQAGLNAVGSGDPLYDTADGTSAWTYPFDTSLYTADVQDYRINVRATDRAGNTRETVFHVDTLRQQLGTIPTVNDLYAAQASSSDVDGVPLTDLTGASLDLTVDQEQDLPQFEFSIPSLTDNDLGEDALAAGSVKDDDGVVPDSIEIKIDDEPWTATQTSGSGTRVNWEYDLSAVSQGAHTLTIRADDVNDQQGIESATIPFNIDFGPPVVELTAPGPGTYHNGEIEVIAAVEDGVGLKNDPGVANRSDIELDPDAVEISLDGGTTWNPVDEVTQVIAPGSGQPGEWTARHSVPTSVAEGALTIRVRAKDIGEQSANASVQVIVDRSNPVLDFLAPTDSAEVNGSVLFQGTTEDRSPLTELSLYDVPHASLDGSQTPIAALTDSTNDFDSDGSGTASSYYRWYKSVDTTSYQVNGEAPVDRTFTIVTTDEAGNVGHTEIGVTIDQATDIPTITVETPSLVAGSLVYRDDTDLVLTFADDDFIDTSTATYDLETAGGTLLESGTAVNFPDEIGLYSSIPVQGSLRLPDVGGEYLLDINVADINGTTDNVPTKTILIDDGAPAITVDPAYDGTVYRMAAFTISGTIFDGLGLAADPVSVSVEGPAGTADLSGFPLSYDAGATPEPTWSQEVPIGDGDGTYTVTITGTDNAGLQSTETRDIIVDTTAPDVTVEPVSGYFGGTIQIGGTASDATSGVAGVFYTLPGGSTRTTDANTWNARNGNLDLSAAPEGALTLEVYAEDRAGNASGITTTTVNVDRADPQLTEVQLTDSLFESNTDVLLQGTADDAAITTGRPVANLELAISRNGATVATVDLTTDAVASDPDFGTWNYTLEADPNGNGDHSADGLYTLTLTATDQAGKTAVLTRVIQIDTTGPTLTVDAPVDGDSTDGNLYTVSGSSRDTGGVGFDGVADVEYNLDGGAWTPLTLSGTSWQGDSIDLGTSEGSHSFAFRSTDRLGNQTEVGPITLFYDTAPPSFTEFSVGTTDTQSVNADLGFGGFAYDSNQLDSLSVSVDGGAEQPITPSTVSLTLDETTDTFSATAHGLADGDRILLGGDTLPELAGGGTLDPTAGYYVTGATTDAFALAETSGGGALDFSTTGAGLQTEEWSHTFDTAALSDGTYILVFTASDIAGKTATATRTVRLDTAAPESLTVDTDLTGWQATQSISVSGTAADSGSGLAAVEYQLDGGAWNLVGGTASWTANIAFNKGNNTLVVRATDRAGNTAQTAPISVDVDVDAPALTVDSPTEIVKLNGGAALPVELSLTDLTSGTGVNSDIAEVLLKAGDTDFSSGATAATLDTGDNASGIWMADVPAADLLALAEGQRTIHVRAADAAGNQAFTSFAVLIDKTAPQVDFSALADGTIVNKTLQLSGTASDTQGLADASPVTLEVYNQTAGAWDAGPAVTGSFSWTATLDTTAYDGAGSDYDTDAGLDGTQLDIRSVATDAAGNAATATRSVTIDQNADRPVIELSNIDVGATSTLKLSRTIYGSVQDDDGPVGSLEVSLDGSTWTEVTVSGGSWSYDIPGAESDGNKNLYFRVTDGAATPTTFDTNAATSLGKPRILVDDTPTYIETPVTFNLDTVTPEIGPNIIVDRSEDGSYDFSGDEENLVTNLPFGGSKADFVLRVLASDANGIGAVSVEIPGATGSPFTAAANGTDGSYDVFDTGTIDLASGIADGSVDVRVSVTDNSGLTSTATRTIIIDNTLPDISYLSPLETSIVNGDVEVRGTASDSGSGLTGVEYEIGYNADGTSWQPVSGSLFSWTIELTGSNRIDLYAGRTATVNDSTDVITVADHGFSDSEQAFVNWSGDEPTGLDATATYYIINATQDTFQLSASQGGAAVDITAPGTGVRVSNASRDTDNDGIWDLPIVFRVTDEATNQRITTDTDYVLQVDPTGDIPNATVVYPDPDSTERTLGGSIRLSGTAVDDDGVAGVYMQIDVDGDGNYGADDTAAGIDWYNGGTGQLVDGTVSWNQTINESGEFNPVVDGPDPRPINFRVRAQDVNGLVGPWTASQLIEVDDDVPQIGSSQPLTLEEQSTGATLSYVADRWLKGTWNLTGSVEDESGIADITISGDVTGSLSANPSWFTALDGNGNYTFDIPVATGASAGRLSFTITATDQSSPQQQTQAVVSVQADNQAPTSNAYTGETPIVQSNLSYTLESSMNEDGSGFGRVAFYFLRPDADGSAPGERIYAPMANDVSTQLTDLTQIDGLWFNEGTAGSRPDQFTLVDGSLAGNENVRVGGLVRIDGLNRRIVSFDSGTGELSWAEGVNTAVTSYGVAYAMVVDNETIETPVYSGDTLVSISNDDGDGMVESIERSGGLYQWTASIDSKNIPDGPIELHWVSFDEAGNYVADSVTTSIANNRPLLAGVTLGTDLDGSGTVEADEKEPAFSALDPEGNEQQTATVASDGFVSKGLTSADIDVVGGNGALQYDLSVDGSTLRTLQPLRADEVSAVQTLELTEADLGADTSGTPKNLVFTIWDSTEESTPGVDSLSAELTAPILVDIVDEIQPKVVVNPFFWNSESDNSLYENGRENGHIEITGVVNGADPDVSGQISIRGTAYDDQRLTSLWMAIDGFGFTGAAATSNSFDTDADGTAETLATTYSQMATFSGGTWTATDQWAAEGWKFSVTSSTLDQSGHEVSWQLDWDSSRVNGVAAIDTVIRALAVDKRSLTAGTNTNASSEAEIAAPGDVTTNNVPAYTVDVVPYITSISNDNFLYGVSNDVLRSATGGYSLDRSTVAANTFTIEGFNFADTGLDVRLYASAADSADDTLGVSISGQQSGAAAATAITMEKAIDTSGYVTVFVNSIPSVNNLNANTDEWANEYDPVLPRSRQWNDDRYINLWTVTQMLPSTSDSTFYYPDMMMDGNQPVFSYTNDNEGSTRRTTSDTTSRRLGYQWYERQTAMDTDDDGNYYVVSAQDAFSGDDIGFLYLNRDRDEAAAIGTQRDPLIELVGEDYVSRQLNRFRYPKLIVEGPGAAARTYVSVYDAHPDETDMKLFAFEAQGFSGGGFNVTFDSNLNEPGTDGEIAGNGWTSVPAVDGGGFSEYFDMVILGDPTGTHTLVLSYYDEVASALRIRYAANPVDANGLYDPATTWYDLTVEPENSFAGSYVSATTDGTDVYLAYHDSANADMKVAKVPGTMLVESGATGSVETYTVDAYLSTGTWTNITMIDGVPHVSYFSGSYNGTRSPIRLAYPLTATTALDHGVIDGTSNGYSGNWEVMAVPAASVPKGGMAQFNRTQIDQYTDGATNVPVVGWLADRLEYSMLADTP